MLKSTDYAELAVSLSRLRRRRCFSELDFLPHRCCVCRPTPAPTATVALPLGTEESLGRVAASWNEERTSFLFFRGGGRYRCSVTVAGSLATSLTVLADGEAPADALDRPTDVRETSVRTTSRRGKDKPKMRDARRNLGRNATQRNATRQTERASVTVRVRRAQEAAVGMPRVAQRRTSIASVAVTRARSTQADRTTVQSIWK